MSTITMRLPSIPTDAPTRGLREQILTVGTFAAGQRAVPVTVTYSAEVGSFGGAAAR